MIKPNCKETLPPIPVTTSEISSVSEATVDGKKVATIIAPPTSTPSSKNSDLLRKKRPAPDLDAGELPACKKAPSSIPQPEVKVCCGQPFKADNIKKALRKALKIVPASENRKLGKGSYGRVEKWIDPDTNAEFAVKMMRQRPKGKVLQPWSSKTKGEINALRCSRHPHCVNTWAIILEQPDSNTYCLINDLSQYPCSASPAFQVKAVISDYIDGADLRDALNSRTALPGAIHSPDFAVKIGSAVAEALASLHRDHLVYRDLKPENVMLNRSTLQPKLIDFGFTKDISKSKTTSTFCGTHKYIAPEILNNEKPYDYKVDAWSLGMLLIEIAGDLDILDLNFPDITDIEETSIPLRAKTLGKMTDVKRKQFLVGEGMRLSVKFDPLLDIITWLTRYNPESRLSVRAATGLLVSMKPKPKPSQTVFSPPESSAGTVPAKSQVK